jgi:hypothetical protein
VFAERKCPTESLWIGAVQAERYIHHLLDNLDQPGQALHFLAGKASIDIQHVRPSIHLVTGDFLNQFGIPTLHRRADALAGTVDELAYD